MKERPKIAEQKKQKTQREINLALVIVSSSQFNKIKSRKKSLDNIIPKVERLLKDNLSISLALSEIITDSEEHINHILEKLMINHKIDSIIFAGGTGLSKKDITYETLTPRLEKKIDGFGELFRHLSYNQIGTSAMLYRITAGILRSRKKNKAIFILPGDPNAVLLALQHIIIPELGNILNLANKEK